MPVFQGPDYVSLQNNSSGNNPSTSSQLLLMNGNLAGADSSSPPAATSSNPTPGGSNNKTTTNRHQHRTAAAPTTSATVRGNGSNSNESPHNLISSSSSTADATDPSIFLNQSSTAPMIPPTTEPPFSSSSSDPITFGIRKPEGFWKGRSALEKVLVILLLLLLFLVILLFCLMGTARDESICTTPGCVRASYNLLSAVDMSVDPCSDFYGYACGSWNREHPIPDDMSSFGTFAYVRERVRQQMRVLLENEEEKTTSRSIKMTRIAYRGCTEMGQRNKLKSYQLLDALDGLGGWPILDKPGSENLTDLLGNARQKYGNEVFFSVYVYADAKNTSQNVLYIDQGVLALGRGSRDYYLNGTRFVKQMNAYQSFVKDVVELLSKDANVTFNPTKIDNELKEMLDLEKRLAKIMMPEAERRNHTRMYNKWTVKQVSETIPQVNWNQYFDLILPSDVRHLISNDTMIIACETEYLKKVAKILEETETRKLVNYALWRFSQGWVKVLDDRFDDIKQKFLRAMTGQEEKSPKWKECVPQPISWMPLAAGALYTKHHFDSKDKAEALEMIGNLREAFGELVNEIDWMDGDTKVVAVDKSKAMLNHIGYPDFIKNETALDKYYATLNISDNTSYFEMVRIVLVWTQEKELRRLAGKFDKDDFEVSPAIVNAFYSPEKNAITRDESICTTPGCVRASYNLLSAVDMSVDPCSDFYGYACGSWNREHPIPDDMSSFGTFAYVRERVRQQMRVLLENEEEKTTSRSIKMTRIAYRGCTEMGQRNKLKSYQLLDALDGLGGWPILDKPGSENLTDLLGNARQKYGNEVFFSVYVYADAKNTSQNVLYIDQGVLALGRGSRDYYLNGTRFVKQMNAYQSFVKDVVELLSKDANVTFNPTKIDNELKEMLDLEKRLAKIMMPEAERRNHTRMYNKWTVKQVSETIPQVNWNQYFDLILPSDVRHLISNDTMIIACETEYLKKVAKILEETETRKLVNYALWRFSQGWVKVLDDRFDDIKQKFLRAMTGQEEKSPKWKECVPQPISWMPLAAGALYTKHHFDSKDKAEALEMIGNLREAFGELVNEIDWMDGDTKVVAVDKSKAMLNHIGYPDFIKNETALDKYYATLNISDNTSYFEMVRIVLVWTQEKELRRLAGKFDKDDFEVSPAIVNAFYSPEKNAITFPAGILQPPFFNGKFPKAINYGAMGAVIGHEITHGFDDQAIHTQKPMASTGSQFDKDGNLNNWWSKKAYDGFRKRTKCIIAQYSNYSVPETDLKVNGRLTQGENIADNGGVKEAYRAYRKYIEKLGHEEPKLPGFEGFTNDQIFFLSYAHFWCGHKKREAAIQQILTDEHSPEIYRVIGVLSNLDEFSKAYQCQKGTRLNPSSKCTVW